MGCARAQPVLTQLLLYARGLSMHSTASQGPVLWRSFPRCQLASPCIPLCSFFLIFPHYCLFPDSRFNFWLTIIGQLGRKHLVPCQAAQQPDCGCSQAALGARGVKQAHTVGDDPEVQQVLPQIHCRGQWICACMLSELRGATDWGPWTLDCIMEPLPVVLARRLCRGPDQRAASCTPGTLALHGHRQGCLFMRWGIHTCRAALQAAAKHRHPASHVLP